MTQLRLFSSHAVIPKCAVIVFAFLTAPLSADRGIPVEVSLEFKYPGCGAEGPNIARGIAADLQSRLHPYTFQVTANKQASNLRITLKLIDSNTVQLSGEFYGYSLNVPQPLGSWTKTFTVPALGIGCTDFIGMVTQVLHLNDPFNELKTVLYHTMPFAKGIKLLHQPPPSVESDAQMQILFPLKPEYASRLTVFEIQYGEDLNRLRAHGVCIMGEQQDAKYAVVQPYAVVLGTPPEGHATTDAVTSHWSDFLGIPGEAENELIYPSLDFRPGPPPQICGRSGYSSPQPKQLPAP